MRQDSRISLYGHDAKNMKNFTLHFDMTEQCASPGHGLWFPVEKTHVYQVQASSFTQDSITDPADLQLKVLSEPELCFSRSQFQRSSLCIARQRSDHVLLPWTHAP